MALKFTLAAKSPQSLARAGLLTTKHGTIPTPCFMTVGTYAAVKALSSEQLLEIGAPIILANAYHLYLRPGQEFFKAVGGLHRFMNWPRAILTDSGGFQLFSLKGLCKISEAGVKFQSHIDGSEHELTPEKVVEMQAVMGVDIAMPLDCFPKGDAPVNEQAEHVERTVRWLKRAEVAKQAYDLDMFAIVQGGTNLKLRKQCLDEILPLSFAGVALGGLSVGEAKSAMWETVDFCCQESPAEKPRYLMGVGTPEDLLEAVGWGVDMFDCVLPTRNARNGMLFTSQGNLVITNARYYKDERPIDPTCACFVCQNYSRAYIRYLAKCDEIAGIMLRTYHNVFYYQHLMKMMRSAIEAGDFLKWRENFKEKRRELNDESTFAESLA